MPINPPTNENISFLDNGARDSFPTASDADDSGVAEKYKRVWAEYNNKIRNFIGIVEPYCTSETAENQGIKGLTYWTLNPSPTLNDIIYGFSKKAYDQGKSPPTTVYPFEIVITSSTIDYSAIPRFFRITPLVYQATQAVINRIALGNLATIKPMVQCSIKSSNEDYFSTRWAVNSYCINGTDTLLIRGSIIDGDGTGILTTGLPPITASFPNGDIQRLFVSLVGVRT